MTDDAVGSTTGLDRDRLIAEAVAQAGADDFGEATWSEGLDQLMAAWESEARLNAVGVEVAKADVINVLATRLRIIAWRASHPSVADEQVGAPIVIMGQPRTGTTILHDLLAQDPDLRAPLSWEVSKPVPPPVAETYRSDPRIAEVQSGFDLTELVNPGFHAFHPMGAELAQECVQLTAGDFRSMMFPVVYRVPTYSSWLLDQADLASAYRWHRVYLQHLQSAGVRGQWLLKSPAHLWHLDALAAEYPGAVVVQTHRDPLQVISSVSALVAHLRRLTTDDPTVAESAAQYAPEIIAGLERGMAARDRDVFPPSQVVDVRFTDFMSDPIATIRRIYVQLDRELSPTTEERMRAFLVAHPGDGGGGRYTWADTGLDEAEVRPQVKAYQDRYDVPTEALR